MAVKAERLTPKYIANAAETLLETKVLSNTVGLEPNGDRADITGKDAVAAHEEGIVLLGFRGASLGD